MSDDHDMLRDALAARLARTGAADAWAALGEAGVHALTVAEAQGGAGADLATAAVVADVLGDLCLPTPFIEQHVVARLVDGVNGGAAAVRSALVAGEIVGLAGLEPALATTLSVQNSAISGTAQLVTDAGDARQFIAIVEQAGAPSLWLVERSDAVEVRGYATIDGRLAGDVSFADAPAVLLLADAGDAISAARDDAVMLLAIEAAALMQSLVRQTTDYARQREQFGQAIGKFQAVQHRIVDMHIAARRAGAIARAAVASASGPATERSRMASAAKATINETGRFVGQNAVQLHGGMGMTEELAVGRYFKRLTVIETQLGGTSDHVRRFGEAMAAA